MEACPFQVRKQLQDQKQMEESKLIEKIVEEMQEEPSHQPLAVSSFGCGESSVSRLSEQSLLLQVTIT